jgi:polyhydroxybutyrate depolymerase
VARHWVIGLATAASAALPACSEAPHPAELEIALAPYSTLASAAACGRGTKAGLPGASDALRSSAGIAYNVRAPANYDSTWAHPLLMVFAPAGSSAKTSEALTRLTAVATQRGFVVGYVTHRALSAQAVQDLAKIPAEIAQRWCIDSARVFATGHSDGGTVSTAMALLGETRGGLAGIAPSAAGFAPQAFAAYACPAPVPVMVLHGKRDRLFPSWGQQAAQWWARCNGCDTSKTMPRGLHCVAFQDCAERGATLYCESDGAHTDWPPLGAEIVHFFEGSAATAR